MREEENILQQNSNEENANENISEQKSINQPSSENMEVHHHPKVEKKNFKEYFLEFIMIFLAVTMGFIAENLRENISDSHREKAFAQELYTELQDDSTVVANKVLLRLDKEKEMEHLSAYFKDSSLTVLPKSFYPAFVKDLYLINTYAFEPKDGILTQLKNSGAILNFKKY